MFTFLSSLSPFALFAEWYIFLEYKSFQKNERALKFGMMFVQVLIFNRSTAFVFIYKTL